MAARANGNMSGPDQGTTVITEDHQNHDEQFNDEFTLETVRQMLMSPPPISGPTQDKTAINGQDVHQLMHGFDSHRFMSINEMNDKDVNMEQVEQMTRLIEEGKAKASELNVTLKTIEHTTARLQHQYNKSQAEINDTFQFYVSLLEEVKSETLKELDESYNAKLVSLTLLNSKIREAIERVANIALFKDRYQKFSSPNEHMFFKQLIESKMRTLLNFDPEVDKLNADLEFISNFQAIRVSFFAHEQIFVV